MIKYVISFSILFSLGCKSSFDGVYLIRYEAPFGTYDFQDKCNNLNERNSGPIQSLHICDYLVSIRNDKSYFKLVDYGDSCSFRELIDFEKGKYIYDTITFPVYSPLPTGLKKFHYKNGIVYYVMNDSIYWPYIDTKSKLQSTSDIVFNSLTNLPVRFKCIEDTIIQIKNSKFKCLKITGQEERRKGDVCIDCPYFGSTFKIFVEKNSFVPLLILKEKYSDGLHYDTVAIVKSISKLETGNFDLLNQDSVSLRRQKF